MELVTGLIKVSPNFVPLLWLFLSA